jgi:hypothetical protein
LLLAVSEPPERVAFRLAWSRFRRRHQAVAKQGHCTRRERLHPPHADRLTIHRLAWPFTELTDVRWTGIAAMLPPPASTGRLVHEHRRLLAGMLWVMRMGATWREVPEQFGPWHTVYTRYQEWRHAGIWPDILAALTPDPSVDLTDLSL